MPQIEVSPARNKNSIGRAKELDVRLKAGAPVIDMGVLLPAITDGFSGNAPHVGRTNSAQNPTPRARAA